MGACKEQVPVLKQIWDRLKNKGITDRQKMVFSLQSYVITYTLEWKLGLGTEDVSPVNVSVKTIHKNSSRTIHKAVKSTSDICLSLRIASIFHMIFLNNVKSTGRNSELVSSMIRYDALVQMASYLSFVMYHIFLKKLKTSLYSIIYVNI